MLKKISFLLILLVLFSCKEDETSNDFEGDINIEFNYTLASNVSQLISTSNKGDIKQANRTSEGVMANMTITDTSDNSQTITSIIVYLDTDTFTVSSPFEISLKPGTYSFLVTFNYLNYDYIGVSTANVTVSDGNTQAVNISFSPVIGDANLEYTISNLSTLLFDYDTSLLTDVSIPKIGYAIDSDPEIIIELNTILEAGLNQVYINLANGNHNIKLRFFDDNVQIGKSIVSQETINYSPGSTHTMDIVPLTADLSITTTSDGGDLEMNLELPYDIVGGITGKTDITADIKITGTLTGTSLGNLTFTDNSVSYSGSVTMTDIYYENVNIFITLYDGANEIFNIVYSNITINNQETTITQPIGVPVEAIKSDKIFGSVLLKTEDIFGIGVNNINIYIDGNLLGSTGTLTTGSSGLYQFTHESGIFTIELSKAGKTMQQVVYLAPLEVKNISFNWFDNAHDYLIDYKVIRDLYNLNTEAVDALITWDWDKELSNITLNNWKNIISQFSANNTLFDSNDRITKLIIKNIDIAILPSSIGNMTELNNLTIRGTQIAEIPNEIEGLTKLTKLKLYNNKITTLPSGIGNLSLLRQLHIQDNKLTEIPDEIWNLTNLTNIKLSSNDLTMIPSDIQNLINLQVLYLSDNHIMEIPLEISNLSNLKKLYVEDLPIDCLYQQIWNMRTSGNFNTTITGITYKNWGANQTICP